MSRMIQRIVPIHSPPSKLNSGAGGAREENVNWFNLNPMHRRPTSAIARIARIPRNGLRHCRTMSELSAELPGPVHRKFPDGDGKARLVYVVGEWCDECGFVKYHNPTPVAGVVVTDTDPVTGKTRVLLIKRDIPPKKGYWTIPGGFVEAFESSQDGAAREALEEANARVEVSSLFCVHEVPHVATLMLWYRASFADPTPERGEPDLRFSAGEETAEAALFPLDEIPWDQLAFPTTRVTLEALVEDPVGEKGVHHEIIHERI